MKIKSILTTAILAVGFNGAFAGEWCPPAKEECCCPTTDDCCPGGEVGIDYMTDYVFRGVRLSRDTVAAHANYNFGGLATVGVSHYTSLASPVAGSPINGMDQTNLFAAACLPSVMGFDASLRYDHYLYPNLRTPSGNAGQIGDSHGAVSLTLSREIACGLIASYTGTYDLNGGSSAVFLANTANEGAWLHTLQLATEVSLTDSITANIKGGVLYSDNIWQAQLAGNRSSGWNNYFVEAGVPICLSSCATLTPYVGYVGAPDTWVADGVAPIAGGGTDILHGGVRLSVSF